MYKREVIMKVLHILNELKYSGAEIMYCRAATNFQNLGCELTVLSTARDIGEYASQFEKAGYKVCHISCGDNFFNKILFTKKLISFIKLNKFDVVHIHSHKMLWWGSLATRLAGCASIYTFHSVFKSRRVTYIIHFLRRWIPRVILGCSYQTISDSVEKNELYHWHNKTTKIYNWYDSNRFSPASYSTKFRVRQALGIPEKMKVVISVGGCSKIKRHSEIIKALPGVIDKYPDFLYLHIGTGETEVEETELTKKLNLCNHIRFCGNQNNVKQYLIAADIYIMPSLVEGISVTTIEALACEKPAIVYDVAGLRDFNRTGENTFCIDEDYNLLAKKIIYLFKNREHAQQVARNGRAFVERTFNMNKNTETIYKLYQKVLNNSKGKRQ